MFIFLLIWIILFWDKGQPGPIETMQSLLFTEQMRPGSRGTRGDLDQLEQKPSVSQVWT